MNDAQPTKSAQLESHIKYRPDIDGLRAFAVVAVVLYHAFPSKFPGGFVGVDIFFVISGFLISSIIFKALKSNTFRFSDFYARRSKRIFPVLAVVLICCLLLGWLEFLPDDFRLLGKHLAAGAGFCSNLLLWSETGYFDQSSTLKPLLHLWSLGIEEQFYLIWPLLLWCYWKANKNPISLILIGSLLSFLCCLYLTYHNQAAAFYSPLSRFWELGIGSALAWLTGSPNPLVKKFLNKSNLLKKRWRSIGSFIGFSILVLAVSITSEKSNFPGLLALLPTLGSAMLIAAGPNAPFNRYVLSLRIFVFVGLISYPLYLWHWPIFSYLYMTAYEYSANQLVEMRVFAIFLSLLLAWLSWRLIEVPFKKLKFESAKPALLLIGLALVGLTGIGIFRSDGFPGRFPIQVQNVIAPIDFRFTEHSRFGVCHYDSGNGANAAVGKAECVEKTRPLVLIWGDSYASALYAGLASLQKNVSFGIAQATSCGTPPIEEIDWDNTCQNRFRMNEWNRQVLQLIEKEKPEYVILHGFWQAYGGEKFLLKQMPKIVPQIRARAPKARIILIGSVPQWGQPQDGLPKAMYHYWKNSHERAFAPQFMNYGLDDSFKAETPEFIEAMKGLKLTYVSPYSALCNEHGCLTRTGNLPTDLTAIDQGHLSPAGSTYLFQKVKDQIFR